MRAALCRRPGPPEAVELAERANPALTASSVRVRVAAAAVNFPDVLLVAGTYQMSVPTPFVPGSEFAGVVAETAEGVSEFAVGDRVSGASLYGAFAEEVVVPARALTHIPTGVDDRHAAAFGVTYRTAYHALRSTAVLRPGDELVVLGAGGGIGLAAVQLGALLGASVTAVASSRAKLDAAAARGARHLIRHRADDLRPALRDALPDGADAVLDPVGGERSEPALRSLRLGGRFVTVGYASGVIPRIPLNLVLIKGVRLAGFQLQDVATRLPDEFREHEKQLDRMLATHEVSPYISEAFPLRDAARALGRVADGHAIGKVVLEVTDSS